MSYDITPMWNIKKNDTNELINKTETDIETKLMVTRRETWGGIN